MFGIGLVLTHLKPLLIIDLMMTVNSFCYAIAVPSLIQKLCNVQHYQCPFHYKTLSLRIRAVEFDERRQKKNQLDFFCLAHKLA